MREILFRGKRLDNGEWVEGAFLNDRDGVFYICPAVSDISYGDSGNRMRIGCWYKVASSTVGQCTGLKDKNGKKIFEGDIVDILTENEEIGVIEYDDGGFQVEADGFIVDFHANINGTDLEVIGNIHDNKLEDFDNGR